MRRAAPRALWWRWFQATTGGEVLGFLVPALAGAVVTGRGLPAAVVFACLVAAGTAEGGVLGLAQALALRAALPELRTNAWVCATAVAAAVSWAIGSVPVATGSGIAAVPRAALVGCGAVLLLSMGVLQWTVLRRHVRHAVWWIPATAAAWLAGLVAFLAVTTPLWQEGQPAAVLVAIGALGGLVMAAVVAAVTGLALVRLVHR
jgi:hypothetical protein